MLRQNKPESVIHKTNANEVKVSTKCKKRYEMTVRNNPHSAQFWGALEGEVTVSTKYIYTVWYAPIH